MSVIKISTKEFNDILINEYVLVDFYADWCGPCKMISRVVDDLSNEIDDVTFAKVNIDESSEIASMFNVMSIPTLILFKNGKVVGKRVGFQSKDELKKFIIENK